MKKLVTLCAAAFISAATFADWVLDESASYETETEIVSVYHWFTEGMSRKFGIPAFTWLNPRTGRVSVFSGYDNLLSIDVPGGTDICQVSDASVNMNLDNLPPILTSDDGQTRIAKSDLMATPAWQEVLQRLYDAVDEFNRNNPPDGESCPKTEITEKEPPQIPPPPPDPVPLEECEHTEGYTFDDKYCICLACGEKFEHLPYEYTTLDTCKACPRCGKPSPNIDDHSGWHNVGGKCVCHGGAMVLEHLRNYTGRYGQDAHTSDFVCRRELGCTRCAPTGEDFGYTWLEDAEHAFGDDFEAIADGVNTCRWEYVCSHGTLPSGDDAGCGRHVVRIEPHTWDLSYAVALPAGDPAADEMHGRRHQCQLCGETFDDTPEAHIYGDWKYDAENADEENHIAFRTCEGDNDPRFYCGHNQLGDAEPHEWGEASFVDLDDQNHSNVVACSVCAYTKTALEGHTFLPDGGAWEYDEHDHWKASQCDCGHVYTNVAATAHGMCLVACECGYTPGHLGPFTFETRPASKVCQYCGGTFIGEATVKVCGKCGGDVESVVDWEPHTCNGFVVKGPGQLTVTCAEGETLCGVAGPGGTIPWAGVFGLSGSTAYGSPAGLSFGGQTFSVDTTGWYEFQCASDDDGNLAGMCSSTLNHQSPVVRRKLVAGEEYPLTASVNSIGGPIFLTPVKFCVWSEDQSND